MRHIIVTNVVFLSTDSKAGHKLFEPDITTNANVSNWARNCNTKIFKDKNKYCKNWVGIKWDQTDSKFKYESNNEILAWGNFKYPENYIANKTHHRCKSCTNDYRVYAQITTNSKEAKWYLDKNSEDHAFICETTVSKVCVF